ncbi:MAG: dermonecrotic toxin domain-containing protein, partial [Pseudomonas sp.]
LLEVLLQAVLDGKALDLEKIHDQQHGLTFVEPYRFEGSDGFEFIALKDITDSINDLLLELPFHFQQAQVDYWLATSTAGVSRDRWLQLTLKSALLRNLPLQGLDDQQQACIYGLFKVGDERSQVFAVEAQLQAVEKSYGYRLPDLLVVGEWDEREVVLWCSPSSVVKAFGSLDEFALALRDELAARYSFTSMTWNRYELEGDVFSQQTALMLNAMLDTLQQVRGLRLSGVEDMEAMYAALTDPAQWFIEGYVASTDTNVAEPPGVRNASAADSFAYQCGLFELALAQVESKGIAALNDVQDLHSYASDQLRAQMLADHPQDANYFSDDLSLTFTLASGVPGGAGTGVGDGVV